jgi:hypothetical protein
MLLPRARRQADSQGRFRPEAVLRLADSNDRYAAVAVGRPSPGNTLATTTVTGLTDPHWRGRLLWAGSAVVHARLRDSLIDDRFCVRATGKPTPTGRSRPASRSNAAEFRLHRVLLQPDAEGATLRRTHWPFLH